MWKGGGEMVSHKLQRDDNIKPNIREIGSIPEA